MNNRRGHRAHQSTSNEACNQPPQAPSAQENTILIGAPDVAIQAATFTRRYTHYLVYDRANCRIYELLDAYGSWPGLGERTTLVERAEEFLDSYRSWPGLGERRMPLERADDRSQIYARDLEAKINAYIRDHHQSQGTLPLGRWLIRNEDGSFFNCHPRPGPSSIFGSTGSNNGVRVPHQCYSRPYEFPRQERFWCAPFHPGPCNIVDGNCVARRSRSDNIEPRTRSRL